MIEVARNTVKWGLLKGNLLKNNTRKAMYDVIQQAVDLGYAREDVSISVTDNAKDYERNFIASVPEDKVIKPKPSRKKSTK